MPIGIQFVAGLGEDELLLRLSRQIETEQSWLDEWPPVALGESPPEPVTECMNLLIINPNTSSSVTEKIRLVAEQAAAPGTRD